MTKPNFRKCPLCQQETARDHEFCDHCGRGIGDYCADCGAKRTPNGTFCVKCGYEFKPFPVAPPGLVQAGEEQAEIPMEEEPPAPFLPVWFKRLILGAVLLFVVFGFGLWLTVWFMRQWAEMGGGEKTITPSAKIAQSAGEKNAFSNAPPIMIPDSIPTFSKDPRWQARFEHWYVVYLPKFKPLSPGTLVEVETRTGVRMTGTLVAISNQVITLNREGMQIGFETSQLTLQSLSQFFREAYAQGQATTEVEREQHSEGQSQTRHTVAATRSANRPDIKPGVTAGPATPVTPPTEFQSDLAVFKQSMVRLLISLLVIVGVVVVVRHVW